jgi:peptidoglycan/LPS O-acetylase OafA/YrhL
MSHRLTHIDATKTVASHLIVLHHFTAYGPLAFALDREAPQLTDWLFDYARMAVQVFLVIGGYFAASSLAPHGYFQRKNPWHSVLQRYVRLVPPFSVALLFTILCSILARQWLDDDFIPLAPGWSQMAAHLTLLFGVLEMEPLSAGIWYVAIDFQLFAMMAIVLWVSRRQALLLVVPLMLASLFFFNSATGNDNWAPYFFGAYAMGAFAWWAVHSPHGTRMLVMLAAVGIAALVWDFRLRIALALAVALWLGYARSAMTRHEATSKSLHPALIRWIRRSGHSSYALFLTHFSVLMLANVVWARRPWTFDGAALVFTVCAWLCCIVLALLFERWVERPLSAVGSRL